MNGDGNTIKNVLNILMWCQRVYSTQPRVRFNSGLVKRGTEGY